MKNATVQQRSLPSPAWSTSLETSLYKHFVSARWQKQCFCRALFGARHRLRDAAAENSLFRRRREENQASGAYGTAGLDCRTKRRKSERFLPTRPGVSPVLLGKWTRGRKKPRRCACNDA